MEILNPPKSYIAYRCYIHGLSGQELSYAQDKFYKKHSENKGEIVRFFNLIKDQREKRLCPFEKIEVREEDGKKHGRIETAMIYDIEYWIEGNKIKQKKIYMADQGVF
jgi:hypothetical protein